MTQPTIGRIVHYMLNEADATAINKRRKDFAQYLVHGAQTGHIGHVGNEAREGQVYPATVVYVFGGGSPINLQVMLDGNDSYWATSRTEGDGPGRWSWPPRV